MTRAQVARHKKRFLEAFALHGNVSAACRAAGIARRTVYQWQEHDEAFLVEYRRAELDATEILEGEAFRRAYEGVTSEKFTPHGVEREVKYSDTLLIFLLKARNPEKYRERYQLEHTGRDGGPIQHEVADARDRLAGRIAGIAARLGAGGGAGQPNEEASGGA